MPCTRSRRLAPAYRHRPLPSISQYYGSSTAADSMNPVTSSHAWKPHRATLDRINHTIAHAWRPSTSKRYALAVAQFTDFCTREGVPLSACLPASEDLLCAFASSFVGLNAGATIRNKCSALRSWHIQNNVPWYGGVQLAYVVKGAENLRPVDSKRPERPAVSVDMLEALQNTLNLSLPLDACVYFIATACFWGQMRLGEILPSRENFASHDKFPVWSDLKAPNANGSRVLHLPVTKTGGTKGENVIITRQVVADPIEALLTHAYINDCPLTDHISSYISSRGTRIALTRRRFLLRVNEVLSQSGFESISGHCFRIGGTTHLLLAGVPPDIVKIMGRWSSDAFLRYWRSLEIIAPLHCELLKPLLKDTKLIRSSA